MKNLLCLVCMIYGTALYAGNGDGSRTVGNGGDVIKCPESPTAYSYKILDWYEGSVIRSLNLDLGVTELSLEDKL
ncbi:MAG: hypothetical protein K2Q18_11550, partial [Bdellovibrionales bacterium]|nr:hypothetical protein [Bdellovibrionales bacterium]